MSRSRKQSWLRDELILALELYRRHGRIVPRKDLEALSSILRTLPVERDLAIDPTFRNVNSVQLKIYNFVAIDPDAETDGMSRGGHADREVWDEFAMDWSRLTSTAAAIRANARALNPDQAAQEECDIKDAPEGRLLTRMHRVRERNRALVERKKRQAASAGHGLRCQGCGFEFAAAYGPHGVGFIECHHTVPLSKLRPGQRSKTEDLALVCSNCHRMIHRRSKWLTMPELRALVSAASQRHQSTVTP